MSSDATYSLRDPVALHPREASTPNAGRGFLVRMLLFDLTIALCLLHGWAIWIGMGGREGLTNEWPLWRDDHPLYYHSALITRTFLAQTRTTAGYDPAFMSGYAKSFIFPSSSTLPELVLFGFGGERPELAYKVYVLVAAAAVPWLILIAAFWLRASAGGACLAVALALTYLWTDFPINYARFGMLPYLLAIPLGLIATGSIAGFVGRGGLVRWLIASLAASACVLVHFTSAMIVVPAAAACYVAGIVVERRRGEPFPFSRHLGVWLIPVAVLALNAFWWLPGVSLWSTKGPSDFAFSHSTEPVARRLWQIVATESPIEGVLIAMGLVGLAATIRRTPIAGVGLLVFAVMGFAWGYLAGLSRSLDFLQPGRHTYAFYSAMAVSGGLGWAELCRRLRAGRGALDVFATLGLGLVGFQTFAPLIDLTVSTQLALPRSMLTSTFPLLSWRFPYRAQGTPFLSSRPSERLLWVVGRIKEHVRPGERLLYEEAGFAVPGEPDPFDGGRFSGLLPERCGVEVIGGPYLHASLTTNFTQFGEGKLFGEPIWDRERFVKYARLYRPAAIVGWSLRTRAFCKANPDLIDIKDDDGRVLIGRVKGFEGSTIRGEATVEASRNRLTVRDIKPDLDGLAVLRYHSVPSLRCKPEGMWQPVKIEGDPVPFIGVRPSDGPIELELLIPIPGVGR